MDDPERFNQKPNAFMATLKIKVGSGAKRPAALFCEEESNYDAKIAEFEEKIVKLKAENEELRQTQEPKPAHTLNLQSVPTLGYWNIRGNGSPIRYLLHYIGVKF